MPVSTAKDIAIAMLSELRHGAERSSKIYDELGNAAQNKDNGDLTQSSLVYDRNLADSA